MTDNKPGEWPDIEKILNESLAPILTKIDELEKSNVSIIETQEQLTKLLNEAEENVKQLNAAKTELDAFKTERDAEKNAQKKEEYKKRLNQAAQAQFEELYPEMLKDLAAWENANPDKVFHPVEDTKLGGKSLNQPPIDSATKAHIALQKIGA